MKLLVLAAAVIATAAAAPSPSSGSANGEQMLVEAMDFMARASSTSEVLTLNLTNLLILLVLKALIFGFGLFSFGNAGAAAGAASLNARSYDDEVAFGITEADVTGGLCFLNFMSGNEAKYDCIRRSACEDPKTGSDYLNAAKMWYKMHALIKAIPFHDTYYSVVEGLEEAIEHAGSGGDCSRYQW